MKEKLKLPINCIYWGVLFAFGPVVINTLVGLFLEVAFFKEISQKSFLLLYALGFSCMEHWFLMATIGIFYAIQRTDAARFFMAKKFMLGLTTTMCGLLLQDILQIYLEPVWVLQQNWIFCIPGILLTGLYLIQWFGSSTKFRPIL